MTSFKSSTGNAHSVPPSLSAAPAEPPVPLVPRERPAPPLQKITPLDVQLAWAHREPDETLTLTELLLGALKAKRDGDSGRALLLLGQVNRRLAARQLDAARELSRERTEAGL